MNAPVDHQSIDMDVRCSKLDRGMTCIDIHVALRLKAARRDAGLTLNEAGNAIGVTHQQMQKYEKAGRGGGNRISCGRLAALAKIYGRPVGCSLRGPILTHPSTRATSEPNSSPRRAAMSSWRACLLSPMRNEPHCFLSCERWRGMRDANLSRMQR